MIIRAALILLRLFVKCTSECKRLLSSVITTRKGNILWTVPLNDRHSQVCFSSHHSRKTLLWSSMPPWSGCTFQSGLGWLADLFSGHVIRFCASTAPLSSLSGDSFQSEKCGNPEVGRVSLFVPVWFLQIWSPPRVPIAWNNMKRQWWHRSNKLVKVNFLTTVRIFHMVLKPDCK